METPSVPEALADQILNLVATLDESPAACIAAAEAVYERLRTGLSMSFGQAGFDALWARAMALVPREREREDALRLGVPGWADALNGRSRDQVRSLIVAALTSFISLLFTFVGAEIGTRLLGQVWPDLPLNMPGTSTGDSTP